MKKIGIPVFTNPSSYSIENYTDKEKAEELGKIYARQYRHNSDLYGDEFVYSNKECSQAANDMAEWKNQQAEILLKETIDYVNKYYNENSSNTILDHNTICMCLGAIKILCKLLKKAFPVDDLHIDFDASN